MRHTMFHFSKMSQVHKSVGGEKMRTELSDSGPGMPFTAIPPNAAVHFPLLLLVGFYCSHTLFHG